MNDGASCEEIVRKTDYDRYLSALFVPERNRRHVFALYAFNQEIAKVADVVREPVLGQIRLQWWRDTVEEIYAGSVRRHDIALALAAAVRATGLPRVDLDTLIDARETDLEAAPFADFAAMEVYAEASSSPLMRLALHVLGGGAAYESHVKHLGAAYALTGLLRAFPYFASKRRLMLPRAELTAAGVTENEIFSGDAPRLRAVTDVIAGAASAHVRLRHFTGIPRRFLPAFLPAALVSPYLRLMTPRDFDPFRDPVELSVPRRQLAMLSAMMRGRI